MIETKKRTNVDKKAVFIMKASSCCYNDLWTCKHPMQTGIKCEKVCNKFKDYKEL